MFNAQIKAGKFIQLTGKLVLALLEAQDMGDFSFYFPHGPPCELLEFVPSIINMWFHRLSILREPDRR